MTKMKRRLLVSLLVVTVAGVGAGLAVAWTAPGDHPCALADRYVQEARDADRAGDAELRDELTEQFVKHETKCNTLRTSWQP